METLRDYYSDMQHVIEEAKAAEPSYVPRQLADKIVAGLMETDVDLLNGWLLQQAPQFVWQAINDRDRSIRARTRAQAGRQRFADAANEFEDTGDDTNLRRFLDMPFSVADGSRKPLAHLDAQDAAYVRDEYQRRADHNALHAAFFAALNRRLERDGGTVADHYSEEQISAMFESLQS